MPSYKNSTSQNKQLGSLIVPPRETVYSEVYFPTLPAGVTMVDGDPRYNPVILSQTVIADTLIAVPAEATEYVVSLYVDSGAVEVKFNSASMAPPLILDAGQPWSRKCFARVINDIRVHFTVAGKVFVQVEKA